MRQFLLIAPMLLATHAAFAQSAAPLLVVGGDQPQAALASPASAASPQPLTAATSAPPPAPVKESERAQLEILKNFPAAAITSVGEKTAGRDRDRIAAPQSPPAPLAPAGDIVTPSPAPPAAPPAPDAPLQKLWPVDTIPIFMRACMGYEPRLLAPCKCVIVNLMQRMPHDEFLQLSAQGRIEQDARLQSIRLQCVGTPGQRQD